MSDPEGINPGGKFLRWSCRGILVRFEVGAKGILDANQGVVLCGGNQVEGDPLRSIRSAKTSPDLLTMIQTDMTVEALERREANSHRGAITYDRFREIIEGDGGFVYAGFCGSGECEQAIKEETKATIRCLPDEEFRSAETPTHCLKCGKASVAEALWAKAY